MKTAFTILVCLPLYFTQLFAQPVWQNASTGTGAGSPATVAKPADVTSGNLLVIGLTFEKGSAEVITPPTGWVLIQRTNNGTDAGLATYYKIATASEQENYNFTIANGSKWCIGISRITGGTNAGILNASATGDTGGNPTAPSITTPANDYLILCFYTNKKSATYTLGGSQAERYDAPNSSEGLPSNCLGSFIKPAAGPTGAQTATPSESERWVAMQVGIPPGVPLPVELVSFQASVCRETAVCLDWETASETNNDYFSIQRSRTLSDWETIARVKGAGNSLTGNSYQFTDYEPFPGTSYYRLLQTDFDGTEAYSAVKSVEINQKHAHPFEVYPNPVADRMVIRMLQERTGELNLYDLNGKKVNPLIEIIYNQGPEITINTALLPKGIYFLEMEGFVYQICKI